MVLRNPLERYWTYGRCEYDSSAYGRAVASVYVWFYFSHLVVAAFSLFFWLLKRRDAYVTYLSFCSTLNACLNYVLIVLVGEPAPTASCSVTYVFCLPPGALTCTIDDDGDTCRACGWPDYNAQALAFVVVVLASTAVRWYPRLVGYSHMLVLFALYMLTIASTAYFHFKSTSQLAAGVVIGTLAGAACHAYGVLVVQPVLDDVLATSLARRLAYDSAFTPRALDAAHSPAPAPRPLDDR